MLDFKRKSRELERNLAGTLRDFHNLNLRGDFGDWAGIVVGT
jgi:hypothetical protein